MPGTGVTAYTDLSFHISNTFIALDGRRKPERREETHSEGDNVAYLALLLAGWI